MNKKTCTACNEVFPIIEFGVNRAKKDGRQAKCQKCLNTARNSLHQNTCGYCKQDFRSYKKGQKYCSLECQKFGRRKRIIVNCSFCSKPIEIKPYKTKDREKHYCGPQCQSEHLKILMQGKGNPNFNSILKQCDECGKDMYVKPYQMKRKHHFCSQECKFHSTKWFRSGKDHHHFKSVTCICAYCSNAFDVKPNKAKKVKTPFCSRDCFQRHQKETNSGSSSPLWNPDISHDDREKYRRFPGYKDWRKAVYERDDYTCQVCGAYSGKLTAHHILNYAAHSDLRLSLDNGITLCRQCHIEFHKTYGYRNNSAQQLKSFVGVQAVYPLL